MSTIVYKKGEKIGMIFADLHTEAEQKPTQDQVNVFFDEVKASAIKAGLRLDMFGLKQDFEKALAKDYGKRKWYEGAQQTQNEILRVTEQFGPRAEKDIIEFPIPEFKP